jgi:hypothetical protein
VLASEFYHSELVVTSSPNCNIMDINRSAFALRYCLCKKHLFICKRCACVHRKLKWWNFNMVCHLWCQQEQFLLCNLSVIFIVTYVCLFIVGCASWQWNSADVL